MQKTAYVYIMTNKHRTTLYVAMTANLPKRIYEYKNHLFKDSFSDNYNLECLVYYEIHDTVLNAIIREKQLKKWNRLKKINIIKQFNPAWADLSDQIIFDGG
jgi:putative endonuclease